jgi:hypothetical protein
VFGLPQASKSIITANKCKKFILGSIAMVGPFLK